MKGVVLTVGNDLMGDDGAGPLLARLLECEPAPGWTAVDGGPMPENELSHIRGLGLDRVVIFDAADMGLAPGEVRFIDAAAISAHAFAGTHALPLSFLIGLLREFVPDVRMLGIQPAVVALAEPLTEAVRVAVESLHTRLREGQGFDGCAALLVEEQEE
ncbi:hydrogenase maturation peptidase HycI [Burkholderia multivorans]|uniref:hydrogenase maturation peptidase HycI n=1 Tax=Burkholderia multivorans TaxID=87883 RepID=UPI000D007907|nr:hydrogenase maturation peptidase HycI [Burkholderia multivorans]PRH18935.1 hydrogenase maturation peptidase HycI [Burkholderia multivorans]